MYYDKKALTLIKNIFKVFILLLIIGVIVLIIKNGFNIVFIKTKTTIDNAKKTFNDRLTKENLKYTLNENFFDFLSKIQSFVEKPYFFVFIISIIVIIIWFYIFYVMTQSYFYDSKVLYKNNDNYNIKHLFGSIYSDYDREKWVNSDENNYINSSGKLCKINMNIFNSCLGEMNSYANKNIFKKKNLTPEFIKETKEILFKKGNHLYIKNCLNNIDESEAIYERNCHYITVKINDIMYNTKNIIINKKILNGNETHESDIISFDDIRMLFPLRDGYFFDIKFLDLNIFFNDTFESSDNILDEDNKDEEIKYLINGEDKKFITSKNTWIKCKINKIETNQTSGNVTILDLIVYNPNNNIKGTQYEIFEITDVSQNLYMGNENTCEESNNKSSIIGKFSILPYLGENLKLIYNEMKENEENTSDLSDIFENDIIRANILKTTDHCIVYAPYNNLIKGDIVKINKGINEKGDPKFREYSVSKYNTKIGDYDDNNIIIGRNYLLCSDSKKNALYSNDLFNFNCKYQQENSIIYEKDEKNVDKYGGNNNNDNYGCK